jgi:DNA phosphorothioation-dependent restriction protein DptH
MSAKQFEVFLTNLFLKANVQQLQAGYRYQFQSADNENSLRLYNAFTDKSDVTITANGIPLKALTCGNTVLLPVLHSEQDNGYSENFISHLRDEVAGQQDEFKNSALLVIHNSMLDTLINSAENVAQINAVWHPEKIKIEMQQLIDPDDPACKVSECLLEHRFSQIVDDGATMFGFEKLYHALLDGDLKFEELGLLNDPAILTWNGKPEQINKRLDENKKLFERLQTVTERFPNELEEKLSENDLGEKFVKKNFTDGNQERWKTDLDFSDCLQEQKKNRQNLLELENETSSHCELIAKSKTETKAGKRDRHLILLLPTEMDNFDFELTFLGGKVEQKQFSIKHNKTDQIKISMPDNTGGKRSRIKVSGIYSGQATYFTVALKRDKTAERYAFKVLVLRADDFYVQAFRNNYLIEPNKQRVTLQIEEMRFVIAQSGAKAQLDEPLKVFDNSDISEINFEQLANESDEVNFIVKGGGTSLTFNIEGAIATDSLSLPLMLDRDRFVKLYNNEYFGCFNRSKNKVLIDNKEVAPKGRRLTLLQWEAEMLDKQLLTRKEEQPDCVQLQDIEDDFADLYLAYSELFEYCTDNKTLPSLSGWGSDFSALVSEVVQCYNSLLAEIGYDRLLTQQEKRLVNIGFYTYEDKEKDTLREFISPFHPLVLAYNLSLSAAISGDDSNSFKTLPKVTLTRLNARGLLPFIYHPIHGYAFSQQDKDNCMWIELVPQMQTSYSYVRKLVKEKVTEFKDAFSVLFSTGSRATLIINSVNNQKNHELFLGLVDYIKSQKDKACQIHVNLYDDNISPCEFDRFAETASYDDLKSFYGLDKGAIREQADTIIDLLRTRLTYSKFRNKDCEIQAQAYAHLSFFRNNTPVEPTDVNVNEELSGVFCHGLLAGEAAANKENSYFTSFGLKNVDTSDNVHLQMAQKLSGLMKPARKSNEQHSRSNSLALAVSDKFKTLLERSYQHSIWTTIIDPKVTLDFFDGATNLVLIHYSDNYTNSANYDAITVTQKTDLYEKVLEEGDGGIIEEFNAFNGEWLLKMITANENDRKEKRGIIGAYKFVNCLLSQSDITWVPLSVAEMIRVAGNIGLKMSDSDFSRYVNGYHAGAISDDVLFVGFKDKQMYLLPVEVKTGKKQTHNKGIKQAKELKRYLTEDILGRADLAGHLYRGLFIRQILMQIDKYQLYKLYPKQYFDALLGEREWWLQGDYQLAELQNYPAGFLVSHVEDDTFFEADFVEVEDILKIQLPISYLKNFVSTPLQTLMQEVCPEKLCHIPKKYLLTTDFKSDLVNSKPQETADGLDKEKLAPVLPLDQQNEGEYLTRENNPFAIEKVAEVKQAPVQATENLKILVGNNVRNDEAVFWEPTNTAKFMNTNSGIIGTMGTGKTQCTKAVVTQLYRDQHKNVDGNPIGILIFDYKSDYVDDKFINATQGKKFNLHKLPYNPLSLFGDMPMLPVHTARGFSETMGKAFGLGQKQQLKLRKLISEAYELAGIEKGSPATWKRAAPTIADVWALFIDNEPTEDSLYAALESLYDLEIFEDDVNKCTSLYELVDGITVVELAGYPSEIQNLVVALTLDLFYSQMQKKGKPEVRGDYRQVTKLVLVDEADNFMSQNFPSLRKILKEGREYGVGMILSTQDITHFKTSENDYSAYVLSWIVHRVSQIKNQDIKSIFNKDDKQEQDNLMKTIRELDKHYSLYVDGDKKITKIKDKAFWELLNDTQ